MPEIASIFQIVNVGVETTSGTAVAANKRLSALMIEPQIRNDISKFKGSGFKFPAVTSLNKEWTEADLSGPITYTEIIYLLSSVMRTATIDSGDTPAIEWTFDIDADAADAQKTYTVEWGDATRALEFNYGLVTDLTLSFSRDGAEIGGTMIGSAITDAITLTSSPTVIALTPVFPTQVSVYFEDAAADFDGTGALSRVVSAEWSLSDRYGPAYFLDGSTDWATHIEVEPTLNVKVKMEKDAAGMALISQMRSGATKFVRIEAIGSIITGAIPYTLQIDTACKVVGEPTFSDEDGVECIEWDMEAFYDPTWTRATQIVVINNLTAL